MKTTIFAAAALAVSAFAAPALAGDPTGLWQTPTNGGQVRIERCASALCGTLVTSAQIRANPDQRDIRNKDESQRTRTLRSCTFENPCSSSSATARTTASGC